MNSRKKILAVSFLAVIGIVSFCFPSGYISPEKVTGIDSLQFPAGYPFPVFSALAQLQHYPSPRYAPANTLMRLFNWTDPLFMGGNGQPGIKRTDAIKTSVQIQEELALHWNYAFVLPNTKMAGSDAAIHSNTNPTGAYIQLANKYPDIPLGVITFWMQTIPKAAGYRYPKATILNKDLNDRFYLHYSQGGKDLKTINYNFPDSLILIDGMTQRFYLSNILGQLTRPINIINENGEEPPGAEFLGRMESDPLMKARKDSLGIKDWKEFAAKEKLRMRQKYVSSFMSLPALKNTVFTCYTVEGGPIDRFDWHIMKKILTPVRGCYYSTPDFYPRWPDNWKDWKGPWHGWKWIEEGRKKEVADGDNLFSPFICAGWSKDPQEDIRPGQWLGLLKCLSAAGAEFFYVGYFNIGKPPFNDPAEYVWQMAMASYAQAITSRYEKDLRNSDLLTDENGHPQVSVSTDDPNVLLVVRKVKKQERYIISATLQPFSNNRDEVPLKKNITVNFDGKTVTFPVRRQGSVYVYDLSQVIDDPVFYQLDSWHEDAHPDKWSKDILIEAEVNDNAYPLKIFTETNRKPLNDFSDFTSFIKLSDTLSASWNISAKSDSVSKNLFIRCRANTEGTLQAAVNGTTLKEVFIKAGKDWQWVKIALPAIAVNKEQARIRIAFKKGRIDADKLLITRNNDLQWNPMW